MVTGEYWWLIYLVFLAIPLARIIPRIISKKRNTSYDDTGNRDYVAKNNNNKSTIAGYGYNASSPSSSSHDNESRHVDSTTKNTNSSMGQTDEMIVLGAMHRGARTFESIQKMTGLGDDLLNSALENLESSKLIRIMHKKGLFGARVELYPTDKGFQKYYS